jgi:hypothetical protein
MLEAVLELAEVPAGRKGGYFVESVLDAFE